MQVTDNVGATTSQVFSITIACPALSIFGSSFDHAEWNAKLSILSFSSRRQVESRRSLGR
jgi:hypothetical protein